MLVVTRYHVPPEEAESFIGRAQRALEVLSGQPGWRSGHIGRAADDPTLWVVTSRWKNVGAYRRALSSYDVKVEAVPLLSLAVDEPSAYEIMMTVPGHDDPVEPGEPSNPVNSGESGEFGEPA